MKTIPTPLRSSTGAAHVGGRNLHRVLRDRLFVDLSQPERNIGDRYHTEAEIAQRFGVSRNTVRRAVADLEADGYVVRRRGVGIILQRKPLNIPGSPPAAASPAKAGTRFRVIVVLPHWNNSPEGFFSRHFLKEISSPTLTPPLAVEIRHYNDTLTLDDVAGAAVIAIDPSKAMIDELTRLQHRGIHVIVVSPASPQPTLITLQSDHRQLVNDIVHHLYDLGHRNIGLMVHDPAHAHFSRALIGFHDAHRDLDLPIQPGAVCQEFRHEKPSHTPDVTRITAWICTYLASVDYVAAACQTASLSVPDDVTVVSFDDPGEGAHPMLQKAVTCIVPDYHQYVSTIHRLLTEPALRGQPSLHNMHAVWLHRQTVAPPPVR